MIHWLNCITRVTVTPSTKGTTVLSTMILACLQIPVKIMACVQTAQDKSTTVLVLTDILDTTVPTILVRNLLVYMGIVLKVKKH